MRAVHGRASHDAIALGHQVLDPPLQVGEGAAEEADDRLVPLDAALRAGRTVSIAAARRAAIARVTDSQESDENQAGRRRSKPLLPET
jgi:hypothetical protein